MEISHAQTVDEARRGTVMPGLYPAQAESWSSHASAVSWGAILAGAAAAAALSLILLILGTGLGLSSVSPWAHDGASASTFGLSTILWLTFTQLVASAMGGYLAGRLRTKWVAVHTDEVYFRDTAHGFLAWAIASLATAALLTSVIGSIVGTGVQAGASVAGTVATGVAGTAAVGAAMTSPGADQRALRYSVDSLFRPAASSTTENTTVAAPLAPTAGASAAAGTASADASQPAVSRAPAQGSEPAMARPMTAMQSSEVSGIFMNSLHTGALPAQDSHYLGQLVAQRTGLTQQEAEKRVTDTYAHVQTQMNEAKTAAKDAADKARQASAYAAMWIFISLLIGAFVASWAATYGGRRRDA